MAARWNSSRAPERPLSHSRSKPWWVLRCAKHISTRFLLSRDLRNAFVPHLPTSHFTGILVDVVRDIAWRLLVAAFLPENNLVTQVLERKSSMKLSRAFQSVNS